MKESDIERTAVIVTFVIICSTAFLLWYAYLGGAWEHDGFWNVIDLFNGSGLIGEITG